MVFVFFGSIYIFQRAATTEDEPEAQVLEAVRAVTLDEAVIDEDSERRPSPAQPVTAGPTPVLTATSPSSSSQAPLKLTSLTRIDRDIYPCNAPHFAPSGEDFLCYLSVKNKPQLWLASLEEGLKWPLVTSQRIQFTWFDDHHILYAHSIEKPFSNIPACPCVEHQ